MTGLNISNKVFRAQTTAIFFKCDIDCLQFLKIEKIFKSNGHYFAFGSVFDGVETNHCIQLYSTTINKQIIVLDADVTGHEIYCDNGIFFVIPYFYL